MGTYMLEEGDLVSYDEHMDVVWQVVKIHDMYAWIVPYQVRHSHTAECLRERCHCNNRGMIVATGHLMSRRYKDFVAAQQTEGRILQFRSKR